MKQISEYTDMELKALGFDQIRLRDQSQANINVIDQELMRRAKLKDEQLQAKPEAEASDT